MTQLGLEFRFVCLQSQKILSLLFPFQLVSHCSLPGDIQGPLEKQGSTLSGPRKPKNLVVLKQIVSSAQPHDALPANPPREPCVSWDRGDLGAECLRMCPDVLETLPSMHLGLVQLRHREGRQKHLQGSSTGIKVQAPQPQKETWMPLIPGYENSNFLQEDSWITKKINPHWWRNKWIESVPLHFFVLFVLLPFSFT